MQLADRFLTHIDKTNSCWLWKSAKTELGYARIFVDGKAKHAHVISYQIFKGDIPTGLEIDHLCSIRHCVNPDHLEAVSKLENIRRAVQRRGPEKFCRKMHHELTKENTYVHPKSSKRSCRKCSFSRYVSSYKYKTKARILN